MNTQDRNQGKGRDSNLTNADRSKGGQHSHQDSTENKSSSAKNKPNKSSYNQK